MSSSQPTLFFSDDAASTAQFVLKDTLCVLGRGASASIRINDPMASWMHAMIWLEGGQVWVMDLHSTNGTRVNGKPVSNKVKLEEDALIQIGNTPIQLSMSGNHGASPRQDTLDTHCDQPGQPYTMTVWYGQDVPDQAMFIARDGSARTTLSAERRVSLVFVLATKLAADRRAGRPPEEQGWCMDDDVGIGVWGRNWWNQRPGRLNVLIHRVRRSLESDGINPDCLQKMSGRLRLWVQDIDIAEPTVQPGFEPLALGKTSGL